MKAILLAGVVQNWTGAGLMIGQVLQRAPGNADPGDYEQLKLFTAGTAATFGSLYLFLFISPENVIPFLIFGAALKTWAFVLSAILRSRNRLSHDMFLTFGVSNLIVAVLFWVYISVESL